MAPQSWWEAETDKLSLATVSQSGWVSWSEHKWQQCTTEQRSQIIGLSCQMKKWLLARKTQELWMTFSSWSGVGGDGIGFSSLYLSSGRVLIVPSTFLFKLYFKIKWLTTKEDRWIFTPDFFMGHWSVAFSECETDPIFKKITVNYEKNAYEKSVNFWELCEAL